VSAERVPHSATSSVAAPEGQVKLALTKPGRLGRLKNDQPSSLLTLPNAPFYVVALKITSRLGTGSTFV